MKKNTRLPNGEAVREFYSSLKTIEEYYWEKGYRKKAYLYRTLKDKLGWKMSLESFMYHFKKAFKPTLATPTEKEEKSLEVPQETKTPKSKPPIFVTVGGEDKDDFFTKNDIPEDRRL